MHFRLISDLAVKISICQIQGQGYSSAFQGMTVLVQGIVTADFDQGSQRGFFIQSQNCDQNAATSDGVFVYIGERLEVVSSGDKVELTGVVQEYYGMTEIIASSAAVNILSHNNPLPTPGELNPPFLNSAARQHFESFEGMLIQLSQGLVVGPTDANDRSWLIQSNLGIERVFHDDPEGTGEVICIDDEGITEILS